MSTADAVQTIHNDVAPSSFDTEVGVLLPCEEQTQADPPCSDDSLPVVHVSTAQIFVYSIANFGVTMAWSVSFALTTPFFAQVLRAGPVVSHFIWALGPISGLVVAPLVGALSDRSTSPYGRRRPFIAAGTAVVAVAMLVFSNAPRIARALVPGDAQESRVHSVSIIIASVAFAFSDFALNANMWPLRALQGDLVPPSQQHAMQGASVAVGSLGDCAAQLLLSYFPQSVTHAPVVFATCVVVLVLTTIIMLCTAKETPWSRVVDQSEPSAKAANTGLLRSLANVPNWMRRLALCNSLCFFALFCMTPNFSSWLGSTVLQGSPESPEGSESALKFERGVTIYGRAGILRSILQIFLAGTYPYIMNHDHAGSVLGFSYLAFGALILALSNTHVEQLGELVVVLFAIPLSVAMTLAIAEASARSDANMRGQLLGLLNTSTCIPQLIDTMYTGFVSDRYGEKWVIRIGGIWALVAAVGGFVLWPHK
jgi:solute carrier family 45, member 1/2/4